MKKFYSPALLTLLATIVAVMLFIAALGNSNGSLTNAFALSAAGSNAPDASWSVPVDISTRSGYDNIRTLRPRLSTGWLM